MSRYRRILLATDFSSVSQVAASEAIELAAHFGADLVCLHIVEHFPEHLPHYRIAHEEMDPQHFIMDRAERELAALCAELGVPDAERHVKLTPHSAKAEIVRFATENDIDLIVIGSRGRHSLIDILSGSTATGVVRAAPCAVFVVHEQSTPNQDC